MQLWNSGTQPTMLLTLIMTFCWCVHVKRSVLQDVSYILQVKLERNTSITPAIWNEDPALPVDEETVSTIGYGTTNSLTGEVSDVLLEVQLPVVNQEVCQDSLLGFSGKDGFLISLATSDDKQLRTG